MQTILTFLAKYNSLENPEVIKNTISEFIAEYLSITKEEVIVVVKKNSFSITASPYIKQELFLRKENFSSEFNKRFPKIILGNLL